MLQRTKSWKYNQGSTPPRRGLRTKVRFARPTREEQQSFMVTLKDLPEPASIQNAKTTPSKGVYTKIDPVDNNFL